MSRHPRRHPAEQPAPADGHGDEVGGAAELACDLDGDRALTGHGVEGVEGRHDDSTGLRSVCRGCACCVVVDLTGDDDVDHVAAEGCDAVALLPRSVARQVDPGPDAEALAGEGDPLGVVARGGGDDSLRALLLAEVGDEGEGASQLVGPHRLQVLALEPDVGAGRGRQALAAVQRGRRQDIGEQGCRLVDGGSGEERGGHPPTVVAPGRPGPARLTRPVHTGGRGVRSSATSLETWCAVSRDSLRSATSTHGG